MSGGAVTSVARASRVGGLRDRLNGTHRRYTWLVRVFPEATLPLLVELAGRARRRRYRRGEVIVAEGEQADRFYIVTSGEAEVMARIADRDVYLGMFGPGASFGEVGLLTSSPRNATVRAVSTVEVLTLDEEAFRQIVERSDSAAEELARVVTERTARSAPRRDAAPMPAWTRLVQRVFKHPRLMH